MAVQISAHWVVLVYTAISSLVVLSIVYRNLRSQLFTTPLSALVPAGLSPTTIPVSIYGGDPAHGHPAGLSLQRARFRVCIVVVINDSVSRKLSMGSMQH